MKGKSSINSRLYLEGREIDLSEDIKIANSYSLATVQDISKKKSSYSKTITVPGSTNNNALLNFLFDIKSTGKYFIAPDTYTAQISNNVSGLIVTGVDLDGSDFALPITDGNSSTSFHNQINYVNWSATVSGNTDASGYMVCKVNGTVISCNRITGAVSTYYFPADKYFYDDVLEMDFQTAYQPFSGNIGYTFDFKKKARAYVIQDNQVILSGYAKLVSANSKNGDVSYSIQITSEIGGFISDLANQRLEDLYTTIDINGDVIDVDSPFDHQLTITNIVQSWEGTNSYIYPLIDYGDDSTINGTNFYTSTLRPCLRVKDYWDAVFASVGYSYSSNFLNSEYFGNLICPYKDGQIKIIDDYPVEVSASGGTGYTSLDNSSAYIFNDVLYDYYGVYDGINEKYTATQTGIYNISTQLTCALQFAPVDTTQLLSNQDISVFVRYDIFNSGGTNYASFEDLYDIANGQIEFEGDTVTSQFSIAFNSTPVFLNQGDYVKVNIVQENNGTFNIVGAIFPDPTTTTGTAALIVYWSSGLQPNLQIILSPKLDGQYLRYKDFCLKDVKQKDFIESVIKLFNLYPVPDKDQPKHFNIYTRDEFFANQNTLDWSDKLDINSDITVQPIPNLDAKQLLFAYKTDRDWWNKLYSSYYGDNNSYGSVRIDTGYEFTPNVKEVMKGIIFSATPTLQFSPVLIAGECAVEIMNTPFVSPTTNSSSNVIMAAGYYAANGNRSPEPTNENPVSNNYSGTKFTNAKVGVHILYFGVEYIISKVFNDYAFQVTDINGDDVTLWRPIIAPNTTNQVNATYYATNDGFSYITRSNVIFNAIVESNDNGVTYKPHKANPRILYFKPLAETTETYNPFYLQYTPYLNSSGIYNYYNGTSSGSTDSGAREFVQAPFCSHLDDPVTPSIDLLFGQPVQLFFNFAGTYPQKNLYSRFWINTVNEISDEESKHVTCSLKLNSVDIGNLDLSNIISINNTNYRINEIKDYTPDDSALTKTELIRLPFFQFVTLPPIVNAGADQTIDEPISGTTFAGSVSVASDDGIVIEEILWSLLSAPSGANVIINNPSNVDSTVTGLTIVGDYIFQLYALDNYGLSASDTMQITVVSHPPCEPTVTASDGGNIILPTSSNTLDGTATGCDGSTIVSTEWTQISGTTVTITNPSSIPTTVTGITGTGTYAFRLTATDNYGNTGYADTSFTVAPAPTVIIQSHSGTMMNVSGIDGLTQDGAVSLPVNSSTGAYNGTYTAFTGAISVILSGASVPSGILYITLSYGGTQIDCINADSGDTTYTFSSHTFDGSTQINIQFTTGRC